MLSTTHYTFSVIDNRQLQDHVFFFFLLSRRVVNKEKREESVVDKSFPMNKEGRRGEELALAILCAQNLTTGNDPRRPLLLVLIFFFSTLLASSHLFENKVKFPKQESIARNVIPQRRLSSYVPVATKFTWVGQTRARVTNTRTMDKEKTDFPCQPNS
jgi:hypothetical protein